MFFWNKICGLIFGFLLLSGISSAQSFQHFPTSHTNYFIKNSPDTSDSVSLFSKNKRVFITRFTEQIVPSNFSVCNYGFFCKKELSVEKATRIPLRVRLGSLQQCNYYEGKR
jgi:hypothetical protein